MAHKLNIPKRTSIILFISVLIALFVIVFFYDPSISLVQSESEFNLPDTGRVQTIKIEGQDTLTLKRKNSGWLVENIHPADLIAVNNLLFAFTRIEIAGMSEMEKIQQNPIKITFDGKRLEFAVYFFLENETPYMFRENSEKIYHVKIQGVSKASLQEIIVDDKNYWLNKKLIDISSDEISWIKVKARQDWGRGFIIENMGDSLILKTIEGKEVPGSATNQDHLQMYVSYFRGLYYESLIETESFDRKIDLNRPEYEVIIEDAKQNMHKIEIFPLIQNNGKRDLFYALVRLNEEEKLFKVNYVYLDLIMQTFEHFTVE